MKILQLFIYLLIIISSKAQHGKHWFFGRNAAVRFDSNQLVSLTGSAMANALFTTSMSDKEGNLLFYATSGMVWNKNHQVMLGGLNLNNIQNGAITDGALNSLPKPGSENLYYLFHSSRLQNNSYNLFYSVVDKNGDSGNGEVILKNVHVRSFCNPVVTTILHQNKRWYWVIVQDYNNPTYFAYLLSDTGLSTQPVITDFSYNVPQVILGQNVQPSIDGSLMIVAPGASNVLLVQRFNQSSGVFSKPLKIIHPFLSIGTGGWSTYLLSPDNSKLYLDNHYTVRQVDLRVLQDTVHVLSYTDIVTLPDTTNNGRFSDMQYGIDHKLYISRLYTPRLSSIKNPNAIGINCNFIDTAIAFQTGICLAMLPNYIPEIDIKLKVVKTGCTSFNFSFFSLYFDSTAYIKWNFGDNCVSLINTPTHTYQFGRDSALVSLSIVKPGNTDTLQVQRWIKLPNKPVVSFTFNNSGCINDSIQFIPSSSATSHHGISSINWLLGDGTNSSIIEPKKKYNDTGRYVVRLSIIDTLGCASDTVTRAVVINKKAFAGFSNTFPTCTNRTVIVADTSYTWNSSISSHHYLLHTSSNVLKDASSASGSYAYTFSTGGSYTLKQIVQTPEGCRDSMVKIITVPEVPTVVTSPVIMLAEGTTGFMKAIASGQQLSYLWNPSIPLSNAQSLQPIVKVLTDTKFVLLVTNGEGCTAADSTWVKVVKKLNFPNAFSPNGDGINDEWLLPNIISYPRATVMIYNRYGQLVYNSIGYSRPWDGRMKGQALPIGTYYYFIQTVPGAPMLTGSVSMLR